MAGGAPATVVVAMVGGTVALVGGIFYASMRARKKRTEAMNLVATTMGFAFQETTTPEELGGFPLMGRGRSRGGRNALSGNLADRPATLCDYSYVIQSGKSSHTVTQTVVVFTNAQPGLPDFELRPENVFHKLVAVFGYQDIDFESHEEFSKRYLLRGVDEEAIRRVFNPHVLMLLAAEPGWSVETAAGRMLVYRTAKVSDAAQIPSFAADALRIAGAFGKG